MQCIMKFSTENRLHFFCSYFFFFWETDIESETLLSWGRSGLFWIDCHVAEMRAVHQVYSILWVKDNK